MKTNKNTVILALTSSAMALPAYSNNTISYRYSNYQEDDVPEGRVVTGSNKRYDIDIHQFRLLSELSDNYKFGLDIAQETLSGASPWYTSDPDNDGNPDLVMSSASIKDERTDVNISGTYINDKTNYTLTLGSSTEDDYQAQSAGIDIAKNFRNRTLDSINAGLSLSADTIDPTNSIFLNQDRLTEEAEKDSLSLYLGAGWIINKLSTIRSTLSYTKLEGYLTDPYKFLDRRPNIKTQWAWTVKYRYFLTKLSTALQTNYRYYTDDWGVDSHTLETSLYTNISESLKFIPSFRFYEQTAADFYRLPGNTDGIFYSDDSRLSNFYAFSGGLTIKVKTDSITYVISGERYVSDGNEHQGLVNYNTFTIGIDYSF